jgi:hypothetical protein
MYSQNYQQISFEASVALKTFFLVTVSTDNKYNFCTTINIVAVEEDHHGGTASEESDVTDTALGRKRNGDVQLGYSGRTALRREQCDGYR